MGGNLKWAHSIFEMGVHLTYWRKALCVNHGRPCLLRTAFLFFPRFSVLLAASAFNPRVLYIHSDGYMIVKQFIHLNLFAVGFFKKPQWKWKSFKQLVSSRYQKGYPSCRYEKLTFTSIERMFCYFMIKLII